MLGLRCAFFELSSMLHKPDEIKPKVDPSHFSLDNDVNQYARHITAPTSLAYPDDSSSSWVITPLAHQVITPCCDGGASTDKLTLM